MSWSKLDDRLHENPKIGALSDKAFRLYILSITYCSSRRTRGKMTPIDAMTVRRLAEATAETIEELVALKAWEKCDDGYCIHDYVPGGGYGNQFARFRKAAAKFRDFVLDRDNRHCLECGAEEDLTIDHKVPLIRGGSNDTDNFQTLCRRCNGRKGARCLG